MENTRNEMPEYNKIFFEKMKNYLDTKIYFFGSVQRPDYFPVASDIDVAIFTSNIKSTITQLQNFLHVEKDDFKKFVWRLNYDNTLVEGYKIMYKEPQNNLVVEISIYDEKYKKSILIEHNGKKELPLYATCCLIIIKFLFYTLNIIPADLYTYLKRQILSTLIFKKEDDYVVFKNKKVE
jgi:predicted nucleotidyltransferase